MAGKRLHVTKPPVKVVSGSYYDQAGWKKKLKFCVKYIELLNVFMIHEPDCRLEHGIFLRVFFGLEFRPNIVRR